MSIWGRVKALELKAKGLYAINNMTCRRANELKARVEKLEQKSDVAAQRVEDAFTKSADRAWGLFMSGSDICSRLAKLENDTKTEEDTGIELGGFKIGSIGEKIIRSIT